MAMKTIERYLARQVYASVSFVMAGFLALFAFFDLVNELGDLGVGSYNLREILTYVGLSVPAHAYELFPVVVLIGTLYVLAYLASNSEYTVMRAAGFSPRDAGWIMVRIGFAFVAATIRTLTMKGVASTGAQRCAASVRYFCASSSRRMNPDCIFGSGK